MYPSWVLISSKDIGFCDILGLIPNARRISTSKILLPVKSPLMRITVHATPTLLTVQSSQLEDKGHDADRITINGGFKPA